MTLSGIKFGTIYYKVSKSDSQVQDKRDYRQVNTDGTLGSDSVLNATIATEGANKADIRGYSSNLGLIYPDDRSRDSFVNSAPTGILIATGTDAHEAIKSEGNSLKTLFEKIQEHLGS